MASRNFYISDPHFYHRGIIKHASRPFPDVTTMNEYIIKQWNDKVTDGDSVYMLGDVCFRDDEYKQDCFDILNVLKGNIHLIIGNHDPSWLLMWPGWRSVQYYKEILDNQDKVVLMHYPIEDWNGKVKGSIHLFGHIHENAITDIANRYCVCVEKTQYEPLTLDEIKVRQPK